MDLELTNTLSTACVVGNRTQSTENSYSSGLLNLPLEVVEYILPHLSAEDIYRLSKVCKQLHHLIFPPQISKYTSRIWRYLDLSSSSCKRDEIKYQIDQGILCKPPVLNNTRTLILDGNCTVTTTDVTRILFGIDEFTDNNFEAWTYANSSVPRHNIHILSIRGCPRIFDSDLARALTNIGRSPTHKFAGPLKGVYYFTDPKLDSKILETARITFLPLKRPSQRHQGLWVNALRAVAGKIIFDGEICQGELHATEGGQGKPIGCRIASVRLATGCAGCGVCPSAEDSKSVAGVSNRALIPPAPLHSSSVASACSYPSHSAAKLTLRCIDCLKDRFCGFCGRWWCLACLNIELAKSDMAIDTGALGATVGAPKKGLVEMNCFECGYQCHDCSSPISRSCGACHSQYCTIHDHGSDETHCEWCNVSNTRRRMRERRSSSSNMGDPPQTQAQPQPGHGMTPADNDISMVLQPALSNYFGNVGLPTSPAATSYAAEAFALAPTPSAAEFAASAPVAPPLTAATAAGVMSSPTPPSQAQPRSATCISTSSRLSSAKLAALYPVISSTSPQSASTTGKGKLAIPRSLPPYTFPSVENPSASGSKSDPYQTFRAAGMRMRTMMVVSTNKDGKVMHVMKAGGAINGKGQGNVGNFNVVPGATMLGDGASRSGRVSGNGGGGDGGASVSAGAGASASLSIAKGKKRQG